MILKASQRAGGNQLAAHLLRTDENEHVSVHELRGFVADDLHGAFHEAYAISWGTRARQFLFSMSLNPPPGEFVPTEDFEIAIDRAEERLGLAGQPRAIVFHEKDGRRHAHAVWSRIDTQAMKAINLPHFKLKLRDLARELYLEHGWELPKGFVSAKGRDPLNFTLAEWQQAKRMNLDSKAVKALFQECWAASDSARAFASAMQARGYTLARGDKRAHVAIDYRGEVYAISRYAGIRTAAVRDRLGDPKNLPSVEDTKTEIARKMTSMLREHITELSARQRAECKKLLCERSTMVQRQRQERTVLQERQNERNLRIPANGAGDSGVNGAGYSGAKLPPSRSAATRVLDYG